MPGLEMEDSIGRLASSGGLGRFVDGALPGRLDGPAPVHSTGQALLNTHIGRERRLALHDLLKAAGRPHE